MNKFIGTKQIEAEPMTRGENPLYDTAVLMKSGDFKDRFKAEYIQLVERYRKLKNMLEKWENGTLEFVPESPKGIYNFQIRAMADYIASLEARAKIEDIEI